MRILWQKPPDGGGIVGHDLYGNDGVGYGDGGGNDGVCALIPLFRYSVILVIRWW